MTIVAGFPGKRVLDSEGVHPDRAYVVLGADSEESGDVLKSSVPKIQIIDKLTCKCVVAGAGNADFTDFSIQEIEHGLTPPFTLASTRQQIEDIVTNIYAERIDHYPPDQQEDQEFALLCALWVKDEGVQLMKVRRGMSLVLKSPATLGAGTHLASYLVATYHYRDMDLYHATRFAVYLLAQVKKHAMYCGGVSQVVHIDDNGNIEQLQPGSIALHERSTSIVMDGGARELLHFVDPMGWGFKPELVNKSIDDAAGHIKEGIRNAFGFLMPPPTQNPGTLGGLPSPGLSTPDSSGPPPSPGSGGTPEGYGEIRP